MSLLRPVGRLIAYGFANIASGERRRPIRMVREVLRIPRFTPLGLMNHNRTVSGVNIGRLWGQVAMLREELAAVLALWQEGKVRPRIDSIHPFAKAAAAHARITERRNVGKVILVP
jgi:NADPH:quinone reductase-like Zn-dependent oxidoreductase